MFTDNQDIAVFLLVVALRVIVPLFIPRFPLPAIIICLVVDGFDKGILESYTNMNLDFYQGYDKALDIYYQTIAFLSTMRNWSSAAAFAVGRFLFYYRLVGVVLFELLQARWMLFVFPNTFEYFFIFYEFVRLRWNPQRWGLKFWGAAGAFIWIVIKLPQEWWIHIAQLDATDFIRDEILVSGRWPLQIAIVLVIIAAGFGVRWLIIDVLGTPSWPLTFDANAPGRDIVAIPEKGVSVARPNHIFTVELAEKVIMFSLISIIFAQILPGVDVKPLSMTLAVATLLVLNLVVSEGLARLGTDFGSAIRQFVIMAVVNSAIVWVVNRVALGGRDLSLGNTLFFVLLLSLLITFYDRYRPLYKDRVAQMDRQFVDEAGALLGRSR
ncbi:MAG: hypothetical protein QM753_16610 [Thermomicrobiales bacterium]